MCIIVQIAAELRTGPGRCDLFQFGCNGVKSSLEGTDKSCAHAAKDLSNTEETTRKGRTGPVSRKGLLYRFASRKAFPHLALCAERPKTRNPKSCIKLGARGGYQPSSTLADGSSHPLPSCLPWRPPRLCAMLFCSSDLGRSLTPRRKARRVSLSNPQESTRKWREIHESRNGPMR